MSILAMCPTYRRPELFKRMLESFDRTRRSGAGLLAYCYEDDPQLSEYMKIKVPEGCMIVVQPRMGLVQALNKMATVDRPGFDYYQEVNDDHIYRTPDWDGILSRAIAGKNNGMSLAWGKTDNLPSAVMFGGKLVRHFEYVFPPQYWHSCVDLWLQAIIQTADIGVHVPEVFVEHMHPCFGKGEKDANHMAVEADYQNGRKVYSDWHDNRIHGDITRLQLAILESKAGVR